VRGIPPRTRPCCPSPSNMLSSQLWSGTGHCSGGNRSAREEMALLSACVNTGTVGARYGSVSLTGASAESLHSQISNFQYDSSHGNIRNKYALFGAWYPSVSKSFDESSIDRPRVWSRADDESVEDSREIQIGDQRRNRTIERNLVDDLGSPRDNLYGGLQQGRRPTLRRVNRSPLSLLVEAFAAFRNRICRTVYSGSTSR
jgi:hypothetical protein